MFIKFSLSVLIVSLLSFKSIASDLYDRKVDRIKSLQSLVKLSKNDIKQFMIDQRAARSTDLKDRIQKQIDAKHRAYLNYTKEIAALKKDLIERFPLKRDELRKMFGDESLSVNQLEGEASLDRYMASLKSKIDKKYEPLNKETEKQSKQWEKRVQQYQDGVERGSDIEFIK